jgi:uncharacterized membrane protein
VPPQEKMIPNISMEEQDMELEPVRFGAGAYASPDPRTSENTLLPAVDNPHEIGALAAIGEGPSEAASGDYKHMKKAELQAEAESREIEGAGDMKKDELVDALEQDDMDNTTKDELLEEARGLEIEGASKMDKEELFYAVKDARVEKGESSGGSEENRVNVARPTMGVPPAPETAPPADPNLANENANQ